MEKGTVILRLDMLFMDLVCNLHRMLAWLFLWF